jgi:hypothetical protein
VAQVRQQVEDGVRHWLARTLLGRLVTELLKLLTPAGAVLAAIEKTYTTVLFFFDKARQFQQLLATVANSLAPLAAGQVDAAATKVEQVLAGFVPLALGFVADFIGLGGLTTAVREQLTKVRTLVNALIDRLLEKVIKLVGNLMAGGQKLAGKAIAGIKKILGYRTEVDGGPGEQHELYFERRAGKVELIIESTPTIIRHFLLQYEHKHGLKPSGFKYAPLTAVRNHLALYAPHYATLATFGNNPDDPAAAPTHQALLGLNDLLSELLRTLFRTNDASGKLSTRTPSSLLSPTLERFKLEGLTGRYVVRPQLKKDSLTYDHQPQAGTLYAAAQLRDQNGQRLFPATSPLAKAAPTEGAVYGYAINLSFLRHINGRTYGRSNLTTNFVNDAKAITHATFNADKKRSDIVDMLIEELRQDVDQMRQVVSTSRMNDPDVWQDVDDMLRSANPSITSGDVLAFKQKIAERILQGERELLKQPMDTLRQPQGSSSAPTP